MPDPKFDRFSTYHTMKLPAEMIEFINLLIKAFYVKPVKRVKQAQEE